MQLVAYGAQDIYLTGNPQITFFKVVYRRHTNFSMESIQQTWNGYTQGANGRCTSTISRNGDLVHKMYLQLPIVSNASSTKSNCGADWIKTVTLEIGGQQIDKHTGQWMEVWSELTQPNPGFTKITNPPGMVSAGGAVSASGALSGTNFQRLTGMGGVAPFSNELSTLLVPLYFWFCRNPGLALPLIALQYHEVKVILDHQITEFAGDGVISLDMTLWVDYIYLDTDERRRFAQVSHEYLIEQLQYQTIDSATQRLNFNHPVKELVWCSASGAIGSLGACDLDRVTTALTATWQLKLNGHDRFAARQVPYFSRQQVHDYHTGPGGLNAKPTCQGQALPGGQSASGTANGFTANGPNVYTDGILVYSFALKPEEHQPSGTCNFSRIDNAQLSTNGTLQGGSTANIYAVNYNVLRIMSGMGGLAYSN